ncbi:DUF3761 domain-containing protein [Occallatibacter riparius]|uniref:DUF3761 domain-containing protein n=1 Tax=Occallatibacter riparius TaxID=1002689 RepID=A0A9J7BYS7_9BACT|nr:DUF3761 domain-containing protein [Occallatibacter riparius]UWZ86725.1 DUF3761 domain-containing protein [Occallatibacter riparius]
MSGQFLRIGLGVMLAAATACYGQGAQAGASGQAAGTSAKPGDATGQCKDGTYTTNPNKKKACAQHQGVKDWYQTVGGATDPDIKGAGTGSQSKTAKQTSKSDETVNPRDNSTMSNQRKDAINKKSPNAVVATPDDNGKTVVGAGANGSGAVAGSGSGRKAAPGGGPGMVWVNTDSSVYHCYGSKNYGKTKNGKYESEQDAVNSGAKPAMGKGCSVK